MLIAEHSTPIEGQTRPMHPILSKEFIAAIELEARANREALQKATVARQTAPHRESTLGALSRLAALVTSTIRQRGEPSGYALSELAADQQREAMPEIAREHDRAGTGMEAGRAARVAVTSRRAVAISRDGSNP